MANVAFPLGFKALLEASIAWLADTIKIQCVSADYAFNASDQFLSDLSHTIGSPGTLSSKTSTGGVANAGATTISAVPAGDDVAAFVIYKDTGSAGTSPLICYLDTANNLPFTPDGTSVQVVYDSGQYGIFQA